MKLREDVKKYIESNYIESYKKTYQMRAAVRILNEVLNLIEKCMEAEDVSASKIEKVLIHFWTKVESARALNEQTKMLIGSVITDESIMSTLIDKGSKDD